MKKHLLLIFLLLCFAAKNVQASGASTANAYLNVGPGANIAAMAEAYAAVAEGAFGAAYNPAGLGKVPGITLGVQHNEWFADMRMEYLSGVIPFGPGGLFASLNYFTYGTLEGRNEEGFLDGKNFQPYDLALSGGYGWEVFQDWMVGGTLTLTQGYIQDYNDAGAGVDLGALWTSPWKGITLGGVFKHIGGNMSGYAWPMQMVLAASSQDLLTEALIADAEVVVPFTDSPIEVALGAQYTLLRVVAFRLGYRAFLGEGPGSLSGLSLGLGVEWRRFDLAYALRPLGDFGLTHRLSVSYAFPPMLAPLGQVEEKAIVHYKKGKAYEQDADWLGALVEYRIAMSLQPDWTEVDAALRRVNSKLKAAAEQQKKREAARAQSVQLSTEEVKADQQMQQALRKHFVKGQDHLDKKEFKKAMREWDIILEFSPNNAEANALLEKTRQALQTQRNQLHQQALAAREKHDMKLEMKYWRDAVELDPEDKLAMENLWLGVMEEPVSNEEKTEKKKQLKW